MAEVNVIYGFQPTLRLVKRLVWIIAFALFWSACSAPVKTDMVIASASSLRTVLPDLINSFEKEHPGIKIEAVYASSGKLAAEIQQASGTSPYDLFLSANYRIAEQVYKQNRSSKPAHFAIAELAICAKDSTYLDVNSWFRNDKFRIAIANPKLAPFGKAAVLFFKNQLPDVAMHDERIVVAQNVQQVNQYVRSGAVDAGLTSSSVHKIWLEAKTRIVRFGGAHVLTQVCSIVDDENETAKEFANFLNSDKAQAVLREASYLAPRK